MENELLDPPETFEPTDPEIFPSGVVIQAAHDGWELLLFGGTTSAQEAMDRWRPTLISANMHVVLATQFKPFYGDCSYDNVHVAWYESYDTPKPARAFPFTPPTKFVGFYSEDHPDVR